MEKYMVKVFMLFAFCFLSCASGVPREIVHLPDEPEHPPNSTVRFKTADSYEQVLEMWKTPEDVSAWIGGNFSYDRERAIQLSETRKTENETPPIYSPLALARQLQARRQILFFCRLQAPCSYCRPIHRHSNICQRIRTLQRTGNC